MPDFSARIAAPSPGFNRISQQLGRVQAPPNAADVPVAGPVLARLQDLFVSRLQGTKGSVPAVALPAASAVQPLNTSGKTPAPAPTASLQPPGNVQKTYASRGTGYYPFNNRMEGGYKDMLGKPLQTLQDFLDGKADYVSIALDENMYEHVIKARRAKYQRTGDPKYKKYLTMQPQVRYGDTFRIPELEQKYGRIIIFKAVDTGGAFRDKGFSRVDIATRNKQDTYERTINNKLTLVKT